MSVVALRRYTVAIAAVIHCSSFCLGAAPIWREAICPFLKIISVGTDWIPYLVAVAGLSSTLSLTILTLSPSEPAISSSAGAIMRQGPHHSAQKSTTTGPEAFNTSVSNVVSDTLPTAIGHLVVVAARRRRSTPNVGMPLPPVKTALRRDQSSHLGVHEVRRNLH